MEREAAADVHRRALAALRAEQDALGDVLAPLSRRLEPTGEAGQALARVLGALFGSGVQKLGRLPFLGGPLLDVLLAESREQRPEHGGAHRPAPGSAGPALAGLAVSAQLREAVGKAFGVAVAPTYDAVYLYDPPGSHVPTHVDRRGYEIVVHLVLEHTLDRGRRPGSALLVHLPSEPEPRRVSVEPGEAVALWGRGTIHSWEPLRDDEHRTLVAIGFTSEA